MLPQSGYSITEQEMKLRPTLPPIIHIYRNTHMLDGCKFVAYFASQGPRRPLQKVEFDDLVPHYFKF